MSQTFRAKVVTAVTGVPHNTLNNWIKGGLFEGWADPPGAGKAREYSFAELIGVRVMREMVAFNVSGVFGVSVVMENRRLLDMAAQGDAGVFVVATRESFEGTERHEVLGWHGTNSGAGDLGRIFAPTTAGASVTSGIVVNLSAMAVELQTLLKESGHVVD